MSDWIEPDEALLSVRRYWADRSERQGFSEIAEAYRSGKSDKSLQQEARAYRAGQAASAERIKALEESIDAARLEGIRLGLEAADKAIEALVSTGDLHIEEETALEEASIAICTLNSETIAREAQDMGSGKETT